MNLVIKFSLQLISVLHFRKFKYFKTLSLLLKMVNWFNVHRSGTMVLASEAEPVFYTYKTVLNIYVLCVSLIMNFSLLGTDSFVFCTWDGFLNANFSIKGIKALQQLAKF